MAQNRYMLDLSGSWNYLLDPHDQGVEECWFDTEFPDNRLIMPGTTNENGIGEPLHPDTALGKESVRSLSVHYRYVGVCWYQKRISIPSDWEHKRITLFFERIMFQSRLWIDGVEAGTQDSLSTPHLYEIDRWVTPGSTHLLTIRIDNRDVQAIGAYPSAYTDETQTIWNGIIGRMEMRASDLVYIEAVQIYPDLAAKKAILKVSIANRTGRPVQAVLDISARSENMNPTRSAPPMKAYCTVAGQSESCDIEYHLGDDMQVWDEFCPALYRLNLALHAANGGQKEQACRDDISITFGMREFAADGTQFAINGRTTFLRGTLDCCIYPLTGYPPTDEASWLRVFRVLKEYGLNHLRFHSWCPPEAAFAAADRTGVFLQVEGPMWMDTWNGVTVGSREEHYAYLPAEGRRIIETYGNHPSFCLYSNGNELNGDFQLLGRMIAELKRMDGRRVYTLTSNWDRPTDPEDDFFVAQTVDGIGVRGQYFLNDLASGTMLDYAQAVSLRSMPIVTHEVGQYAVYPNVDEIPKYTGALRPGNLEAIRKDLADKHMLDDAAGFVSASGKLAVQLYRAEIEAALRTKGLGGFQLLDLHDFPGQSTATVGILDAFWDSKGLIAPERFRRFCGPVVLLLRMPKRICTSGERFEATIEIANFGAEEIRGDTLHWTAVDEQTESVIGQGAVPVERVPVGNGNVIGSISLDDFAAVTGPCKVSVTLSLEKTGYSNDWDVWVYPEAEPERAGDADAGGESIEIAYAYTSETARQLSEGKNVLLLASPSGIRKYNPGKFFPVFWSPVHFTSEDPCGMMVDSAHPVFERFPTEDHGGYNWKGLLEESVTICLDGLPAHFKPIVQVVPNFYHNRRLANLFEAKVGKGKLLVCSIDLENRLAERPEAFQLRRSILAYMAGMKFDPQQELTLEQAGGLFREEGESLPDMEEIILQGSDLALGKPSSADSEQSPEHTAGKGNDGSGDTCWRAADGQTGHWWMVDLGETRKIAGTSITFLTEANYLYAIQVSDDAVNWRVAVNQTGQTKTDRRRTDRFDEKARYVKLLYNGLPQGVSAGHSHFAVYGK